MQIVYILLLISIVLNVLFYYLYRNWEYIFTQKLNKNNFFNDDEVHVKLSRQGEKLHLLVKSTTEELFFQLNHEVDTFDGIKERNKKNSE